MNQTDNAPKQPAKYLITADEFSAFADLHTAVGELYTREGLADLIGHITYLYRLFLDHATADHVTPNYREQMTQFTLGHIEELSRVYEKLERVDVLKIYARKNP